MADRRGTHEWQEPRTWLFRTPMKTEVAWLTIAQIVTWVLMTPGTHNKLAFWLWFPVAWLILTRPWRLLPYLYHHRAVQAAGQKAARAEAQARQEAARAEEQARRGYL